ncbi:MAG: helix-turn-helix domain-containing protein [Planctomycetota bacterium]
MYRKRLGLTQAELAVLLGCAHRSKVSRYERGVRSPSLVTLIGFEIVFRAPVAALYAGQYAKVREEIRARARRLSRKLDAKPMTPATKQKFDALVDVIFPPKVKDA